MAMSDDFIDDGLGSVARRSLHIFALCDTSGSMQSNGRIQSLNQAMSTVLPELKKESDSNPQADVKFRVIEFGTGARWMTADAKPMSEFGSSWHWSDLEAGGVTDLGHAIDLLTAELQPEKLGSYNYPPVLILISDGAPTDDWESALKRFNDTAYGKKPSRTVRAAIAVTGAEKGVLSQFTGNIETVVEATNPTQLAAFLKWATVTLSKASSQSRAVSLDKDESDTQPSTPATAAPAVPPPPVVNIDDDDDLF